MNDLEKGKAAQATVDDTGDLPTLDQVLHRKTLPPVCLYNFYVVMRDRLHSEDYLDFYLDVSSHEKLWKFYLKDLKRSGVVTEQELLDANVDNVLGRALLNRLSYNTISKGGSVRSNLRPMTPEDDTHGLLGSPGPAGRPDSPFTERSTTPGLDASVPFNPKDYSRNSVIAKHDNRQPITRKDVTASAERIYYRYIVPSAEKELHDIPKDIRDRVKHMLEGEGRMDPGVFAESQNAAFNIMETEHFPKFLRYKVWSNTTLIQSILRLILGLCCLFFGFAVELSLIFLNYGSPYTRIWGVIPLFLGVLNLLTAQTKIDPIWVLVFGISETTTFKFNKIRQPIVRVILYRRAVWVLCLSIFLSALLTVIFCVVPSGILYAL